MATDFNALYKEFLTRLKDNDFYADFLSFISRGDNYRLSYDNQIITFMQAGSAFELHTYNDYIQKGYKPFGSYSALLYKRFDLSEGNRKLWADDSVRKIGSVENTDKVNVFNDTAATEIDTLAIDVAYRMCQPGQEDGRVLFGDEG